jgi:peptidoglycan/LPS O-acetylase OafA/YrhL
MKMSAEPGVTGPVGEAIPEVKPVPGSRMYFLDNLKVFLTVLVVFHHAAQPYGPGGGWWIPSEPFSIIDFVVLGIFMAVNASFFMGLYFMISAYFVPSSLERKGASQFMKDRLVKLGVPILIFMIFVFPVMGSLLEGQPSITLGHLWFLALLLIFSGVYVAILKITKPSSRVKRAFPGTATIVAFAVVMALITFIVAIWSPENQWVPLGLFEPFHLTQYALLFAAGIIAYREGWIDTIPPGAAKLWSRIAILLVVLLLVIGSVTDSSEFSGGLTLASLLGTFWEAFMCVSMCITLLALFKNRYDYQTPLTKVLAKNAFTVYLIHIPIVVFLQYLLIGVATDPLIKFVIVGTFGVIISFAASHYVVRRLTFAQRILG